MTTTQTLRPGEVVSDTPLPVDATLAFIGHIETPWHHRADCPRQGDPVAGPDCTIVLNMPWDQALDGIEQFERLDILYWLHQSRRDLVLQNPKHAEAPARHVQSALADPAQSDRAIERAACPARRDSVDRAGSGMRVRHAANRHQTRPMPVYARRLGLNFAANSAV